MRSSAMRGRGAWFVAAVMAVAACTTTATPGTAVTPAPGTTWVTGDSVSTANAWPGFVSPPLATVAVASTGFVRTVDGRNIEANTMAAIDRYGKPARLVVMGGVNDLRAGVSISEIEAAMAGFEQRMRALGIQVVWATEPGWTYAAGLATLSSWIRATRANVIDCAGVISLPGYTADGVHPNAAGNEQLAACIRPEL